MVCECPGGGWCGVVCECPGGGWVEGVAGECILILGIFLILFLKKKRNIKIAPFAMLALKFKKKNIYIYVEVPRKPSI